MLASTVIIEVEGYRFEWFENAAGTKTLKRSRAYGAGLGTIVDSNVIYTHDHSSLLSGYTTGTMHDVLTKIEVFDADGKSLMTLGPESVRSYDTPGRMGILSFQESAIHLESIAEVGDHNALRPGSEIGQVVQARDDRDALEVLWGEFEEWYEYIPEVFITTVNLQGGDSGGGAFYHGRWVGSNWGLPSKVGVSTPPLDVQQE